MVDLHAHLLIDWDDGPSSLEEARKMIDIAKREGIEKIGVAPHIFRLNRHRDDLGIMEEKFNQLTDAFKSFSISFFLAPEVYFCHDLIEKFDKMKRLTINESSYFYLEFPSDYVPSKWQSIFFQLSQKGFIPIISHPERNEVFRQTPVLLYDMVKEGIPTMVTSASITGDFSPTVRRTAHFFLSHNLVSFIASDAHDPEKRPPLLRKAVEEASKLVGEEIAKAMVTTIPQSILENRAIPFFGDPIRPRRKI